MSGWPPEAETLVLVEGPVWPSGKYYVNKSTGERYPGFVSDVVNTCFTSPVAVRRAGGGMVENDPDRFGYEAVEGLANRLGVPFDSFAFGQVEVPVSQIEGFVRVAFEGVIEHPEHSVRLRSGDRRVWLVVCNDLDLHLRVASAALRDQVLAIAARHDLRFLPGGPEEYSFVDEEAAKLNIEEGEVDCAIEYDVDVSRPISAWVGRGKSPNAEDAEREW
jgi:hypothetical protein